ncbi:tetratricopeptide repeat protein [Streptomyces sp. NPDC048644]|uniref:AfsR/SARP family transcriptional regulator n=1 Tax=Streptomyces sp. NPDC048644 TaxID=3365582 RepID=UPI003720D445
MEFWIRLSGSVEVPAAGESDDLRPMKTRLTLAALAWDASRTVSIDTLIRRVWDDTPPAKAKDALYVHISRIRRALGSAGSGAPTIISRANAYVLQVDPDRVDLRCYLSLVAQARALRDSGAPADALRMLDRADGLWGGEPLAGITAYWAEQVRGEVREVSLTAGKLRAGLLLREGRFAEAVPGLLPLAEEHPVDEMLVEQLALALHGSGRTAEATRLLQQTRRRITRDLGSEPGRRLQHIHQGILSGTAADALLPEPVTSGAGAPRGAAPDNLPMDVLWVGRRDELRHLTDALDDAGQAGGPVVTVEAIGGMGGIGKTSLAVHVAHQLRDRFPDGRLYLHLRGHTPDSEPLDPARGLAILLRQLGKENLPQSTEELAALWRTTVQDRRMLVILDDAAGPAQIRPLLPGSSPTAVIVTSRRRLTGLPQIRSISLDEMPVDDAVALFERRLGPHRLPCRTDSAEIVRLAGYIPLAIEILASRLLSRPSWTAADLLRQLNGSGGHLSQIRDGEVRMAHIFALSYRDLTPSQKLVFRRVGRHLGVEFGPQAAAALSGLPFDETERALEALLTGHLLFEPSPHRFRIHDLLREYTRTLIGDEPGEDSDVDSDHDVRQALQRLTAHYLGVADRADRLAYPFRSRSAPLSTRQAPAAEPGSRLADAGDAEQWFITEGGNLLASLEYVRAQDSPGRLAEVVHVLAGFLDMEGYLATAEPLLRAAVAHWRTVRDEHALACALLDLSTVCAHGGHYDEAHTTADEALALARALKMPELESESIHQLTIPLWHTGQYATALELQKHSLNLRLQTSDKLQIARGYNLIGISYLQLNQNEESLKCFTQALAGFTDIGDQRGTYRTVNNIAELQQKLGNLDAAERAYRKAMELSRSMGSRGDYATLQMNLASVLTETGRADEALRLFEAALPALHSVADARGTVIARNGLGRALQAVGRAEEAMTHHLAALVEARRIRATGEEIAALYDLGRVARATGRLQQAAEHWKAGLDLSRRIGARAEEARVRGALAGLQELSELPSGD